MPFLNPGMDDFIGGNRSSRTAGVDVASNGQDPQLCSRSISSSTSARGRGGVLICGFSSHKEMGIGRVSTDHGRGTYR